ncbi:MAG: superoxide dismutase family protein [Pseudomonadota bacterium]|nr:superoxide dismutase family protein [Pseudomonadota bacterium]
MWNLLPRMLTLLLPLLAIPLHAAEDTVKATFINTDGRAIGTVDLRQIESGVLVSARASRLPSGRHGFHFHEAGQCDPQTGFRSAGGHYAPRKNAHGLDAADGPHAGDMPNQTVDERGALRVDLLNSRVSLAGAEAPLLDDDGSALVVHAGRDDYRSQPSGDAGNRIACAAIVQTR